MSGEEIECAAAFFRARGKNLVTPKEFEMSVSLDLKWMSVREAQALQAILLESKAIVLSNGHLKPADDYSDVQVSVAYRPGGALMKKVSERTKGGKPRPAVTKKKAPTRDIFPEMLEIAVGAGMPKGKFVSRSNTVKRRLNIEMAAAALLVLRDAGVDVSGISEKVYNQFKIRDRAPPHG